MDVSAHNPASFAAVVKPSAIDSAKTEMQETAQSTKSKLPVKRIATSKENTHNEAGPDSFANRKRKTSTGSQSSIQSQSVTSAAAKRPALGSVSELEMTWEELQENHGIDVPLLLKTKVPTTLRMDIKGQRDWFREQHGLMRVYVKHIHVMESSLKEETAKLSETIASLEAKRTFELSAMTAAQEKMDTEMFTLRSSMQEIEDQLRDASKRESEMTRDFVQATEAIKVAQAQIVKREEERNKAEAELAATNGKLKSLTDQYSKTQHYNTSLQEYNNKLQSDLSAAGFAQEKVQGEKLALQEEVAMLKASTVVMQAQLETAKAVEAEAEKCCATAQEACETMRSDLTRVTEERDTLVENIKAVESKLEEAEAVLAKKLAAHDAAAVQLTHISSQYEAIKESSTQQVEAQQLKIEELQQLLTQATARVEMAEASSGEAGLHFRQLNDRVALLEKQLEESETRCRTQEGIRRRLHNNLLELKGNIRVFCRVRPPLDDEENGQPSTTLEFAPGDDQRIDLNIASTKATEEGKSLKHSFQFDRVFNGTSTQHDVFEEITQLVQSALDGYKVCIFAYGQTGSGKTHTMMGTGSEVGMIPRSIKQIFDSSAELATRGWQFKIRACMLEIYNEDIRDLLGDGKPTKHNIMHGAHGNTTVTDLTMVDVSTPEEAEGFMDKASAARCVARTDSNARSSRSHCVFTLHLHGHNAQTGQTSQGILNLIDLAGSERLAKSGATGERLKETQSINKSLSSLGDVVMALANKEPHIPFRNSKLTYLLQPCLGGDSKTLMFVNVAPCKESAHESLCSLRFAAKVNSCASGKPKRQQNDLKRMDTM